MVHKGPRGMKQEQSGCKLDDGPVNNKCRALSSPGAAEAARLDVSEDNEKNIVQEMNGSGADLRSTAKEVQ